MTEKELCKKLKKADLICYALNYFSCIFALAIALVVLREAILKPGFEEGYLISFFFLLMSIYGFWRIPKQYSVTKIPSQQSVPEKEIVVGMLSSQFRRSALSKDDNVYILSYSGKFGYTLECTLVLKESCFLINVRSPGGGFVDFGASRRATKEMIGKIKENVTNHNLVNQ